MKVILFIALFCCLVACQKPSESACWKTTGTVESAIQPLSSFQYLSIHPHIEVGLMQDTSNYIEWRAGAQLMSFLVAEQKSDTLLLFNNNRCRFLRYKKGKVKAIVHFKSIKELHLANSEAVNSVNMWHTDELLVYLKEGVGPVGLVLDAQKLTVRNNYGWQTLRLSGSVAALFVDFDGSASLQAPSLTVQDSISFRSSSPLSSWVRSGPIKLKAQLYSTGDLFYTKKPAQLLKTEYSSGKVRPKQ